ncbi:MAG: hypothetical protein HYV59_10915 [Planctomycetes bacterium]|nr:hypothetical protein [Planctomycetota bacterium]
MNQKQLKKDLEKLFKSMDFVSNNFLHGKAVNKKEFQIIDFHTDIAGSDS